VCGEVNLLMRSRTEADVDPRFGVSKANITRAKELMAAPMPQLEPPSVRDTADPHAMPDHRPPAAPLRWDRDLIR
jgi:hypothetical protein